MNVEENDLNKIFRPAKQDLEHFVNNFSKALEIYVLQETHNIEEEVKRIMDVVHASRVE